MAPSCALDEAGLRSQLERYRQAGRNARLIERTPRSLIADLDQGVDAELVAETIAVERECCPFFTLTWEPDRRRLTVSVSQATHEPALDASAFAATARALASRARPSIPGCASARGSSARTSGAQVDRALGAGWGSALESVARRCPRVARSRGVGACGQARLGGSRCGVRGVAARRGAGSCGRGMRRGVRCQRALLRTA
jgi:hypothetical protein